MLGIILAVMPSRRRLPPRVRRSARAVARAVRRRSAADQGLDRALADLRVRRNGRLRIAVIADERISSRSAPALRAGTRRRERVVAATLGSPTEELDLLLVAARTIDAMIVEAHPDRWPPLLARMIFHVQPGGLLIFRGDPGRPPSPLPSRLRTLDLVRSGDRVPDATGKRASDIRARAAAIAGWDQVGPHVVVRRSDGPVTASEPLLKLTHDEADSALARSGLPRGRLLAQVAAVRFTPRCEVVQTDSDVRHTSIEPIEAPAVSLREYEDVTCLPRQLVLQDGIVLPDSFRHPHRRRPQHVFLEDLSPRFSALQDPMEEPLLLDDVPHVHLDSHYQGHYGHLVTDQLSRMWAWQRIQEEVERPRLLMCTVTQRAGGLHPHEKDLLSAFGVDEADVLIFDRPVRVPRLLSAAPMLSNPAYVHPAIDETWRRAGAALAEHAPDRRYAKRIFCSRRSTKRRCRNADEVESLFVEEGFTVVYAEDHPLAEQAAMFRHAEVVAGYAGAAIFNICYVDSPKDIVLLVPESYTAQNEYLMAAVQGHRLTLVWCPSDLPIPESGFSAAAYQSDYVVDLERNGPWLRRRLRAM